jgi:hypothetical protein
MTVIARFFSNLRVRQGGDAGAAVLADYSCGSERGSVPPGACAVPYS